MILSFCKTHCVFSSLLANWFHLAHNNALVVFVVVVFCFIIYSLWVCVHVPKSFKMLLLLFSSINLAQYTDFGHINGNWRCVFEYEYILLFTCDQSHQVVIYLLIHQLLLLFKFFYTVSWHSVCACVRVCLLQHWNLDCTMCFNYQNNVLGVCVCAFK